MSALATMEAFEKLLNESLDSSTPKEGAVVNGSVLAIEAGQAIIDIGYKMEGRVDLREFSVPGQPPEISIGDTVEVYLEKVEGSRGEALLSREKARREEAWERLEKASEKEEDFLGMICSILWLLLLTSSSSYAVTNYNPGGSNVGPPKPGGPPQHRRPSRPAARAVQKTEGATANEKAGEQK